MLEMLLTTRHLPASVLAMFILSGAACETSNPVALAEDNGRLFIWIDQQNDFGSALVAGYTATLEARVFDTEWGQRAPLVEPITFSVEDPRVITLERLSDTSVRATAHAPGLTRVWAHYQEITGTRWVGVQERQPTVVEVTPRTLELQVGDTARFQVEVTDQVGDPIQPGEPVVWVSEDTTVATVDDTGLVTAVGPGGSFVRVHLPSITGLALVLVSP